MRIVPSLDAPHLVFRNQVFGAPMRVGRDAVWMQEWQFERAYRARFRGQVERSPIVDGLWDEEMTSLRLREQAREEQVWTVMVATPIEPLPPTRVG